MYDLNKLICIIRGHLWTEWGLHACWGDRQARNCRRCGRAEERRI